MMRVDTNPDKASRAQVFDDLVVELDPPENRRACEQGATIEPRRP